ncbi:MAG TPA: hypothetical protein VEF04_16090 [Blastocatellia bacterium]|nr:hypothetical protein [Blastocatellia bacterium]
MHWPNFQLDQNNLALLCRPRNVDYTEYHNANQVFGFSWLLRQYAQLPSDEPLPWTMEHAISFDDPEPLQMDIASKLPILFAVTGRQAEIIRPRVKAQVFPIGSAFFYMQQLAHRYLDLNQVPERRGTIVFPDKSTLNKDLDFDRERFAERLANLPAEYQPVAVSVFWKDYERGKHLPFERAGLMLVTSGHAFDPPFLLRQYDLCRQFKYACANDISTSFCLSVLSGCRFFYLPTGAVHIKRDGVKNSYAQEPTLALPGKQACVAASPFPPNEADSTQGELAKLFAGKRFVQPPEFFQEQFAEARRLLQSGPPKSVTLRHGRRIDELGGWLPRGIDPDGWARGTCGLTIPPQSKTHYNSVQLHIHVPHRAVSSDQASFAVKCNGHKTHTFSIRPGFWVLTLPVNNSAVPQRIELQCDSELILSADQRQRSFRLFQITWQEQADDQVRLQRQAVVRWIKGLREPDKWVHGALRGRLARSRMGLVYKYVNAKWFRKLRP